MFKPSLIFIILIFSGWKASSQDTLNPYNAEKIIQRGIDLHDKGEYQEALKLYEQVSRNDSNYLWALTEKSITLLRLKKYDEVINVCRNALTLENTDPLIYSNLGTALDESGDKEGGLKAYDDGIVAFPMNYSLYFNKAITLQRLSRNEEARENYQKALWLNPNHRTSHLRLGYLCASEGKYAEAMLSLITYLLLAPSDTSNLEVLSYLDKFVSQKNTLQTSGRKAPEEDNFSDVNLILSNQLALNPKFKLHVDMDFPIVRQAQALVENLTYNPEDKGFWMQFYVPFFNEVLKKGDWEGFVYDLLISSSNESIQKVLNKNISKIKNFNKWGQDAWSNSQNTIWWKKNVHKEKWDVRRINNAVRVMGKKDQTNGKTGIWEYFDYNGSLTSRGAFINGVKQGIWTYFHTNGGKSGEVNFIRGNPDGIYSEFNQEGQLIKTTVYRDSAKNGNIVYYFPSGDTLSVVPQKKDLNHGFNRTYHPIGTREYQINYVENKIEGKVFKFYDNGTTQTEADFRNGEKDGLFKQFYRSGKLFSSEMYSNGKREGETRYFFENGQVKSIASFKKDRYTGEYKTFYENGNPEDIYPYDEHGRLSGIHQNFDRDGILHYEIDYIDDKPVAERYYSKKKEIIYQNKKNKNSLSYKGFYPNGRIQQEGNFENGVLQGLWKYYDINGILVKEETYDKGFLNGPVTNYFKNGKTDKSTYYKNGEADGPYNEYYSDGTLYSKGYYVSDKLAGEWLHFYPDSTLSGKDYYLDGEIQGWQEDYDVAGHKTVESLVQDGRLIRESIYDTSGNKIETIALKGGNGIYQSHYINKKNRYTCPYVNGVKHGRATRLLPAGGKYFEGDYFGDKVHGLWKWYNEDGALETQGYYFYGERDSVWKYYYPNNQLKSMSYFARGVQTGNYQEYYENGKPKTKGQYLNNDRHGTFEYYNEQGDLMYFLYYYQDEVMGYSYLKSGIPVDTLYLSHGNAKVTTYYNNGKKSMQCEYKNGVPEGKMMIYYPDGQLFAESIYHYGTHHGISKLFYADGILKSEENYFYGNLHGLCNYYYPNGKKEKVMSYKWDKLHGRSSYFDNNGVLKKERIFYNGNLYSEQKK